MNSQRLTPKQLKEYRQEELYHQMNKCALCYELIPEGEEVLDHDHKTGRIRKVLHRGCNAMLGKIENNMPICNIDQLRLLYFLSNVHNYITMNWDHHPFHSTHRTPDEKKALIKKRRKRNKRKKNV